MLRPAAAEAGIDWPVGFHTLRHTCASILFAEGRNAVQVQRWLGHFSPDYTLETYVHLLEDGVGMADFFDAVTSRDERGEQTTQKQPEPVAA